MTINTKLDEKLEGANNFGAWKYRVMLVLEENDLEGFIEANIQEPKEEEAKAKHKKSPCNEILPSCARVRVWWMNPTTSTLLCLLPQIVAPRLGDLNRLER